MVIPVCLVVFLILLYFKSKMGFVFYELLCATNYLVSLSFIQTLDITLPIYIVFALVPYLKSFKIKNFFAMSFLWYFATIMAISVLLNGIWSPLSTILIRLAGLLFFYYVYSNVEFESMHGFEIAASVVCEILLTVLGFILSPNFRLMLNFQCTVGCISTSFVLLCAYDWYKNKSMLSFVAMLIHTLIACISGTRGYILVCLAVTIVSIVLFSSFKQKLVAIPVVIVGIIIEHNSIFQVFESTLRFGESTGRRNSENMFVIKLMLQSPIYNVLFGNGFGTPTKQFQAAPSIISEVADSRYTYVVLHNIDSFHNFYFTILYSAGIVGLLFVIALYCYLFKSALTSCNNRKMKIVIACYLVSYAVLLWYRWSATSGILEFVLVAYILSDLNKQSGTDITIQSKEKV